MTTLCAAALVIAGSAGPVAAAAPYQTTITNSNAAGQQVTRYDTAGNAVDAHDGDLAVFDGVYYLYGTSYDCGYRLQVVGTRFCGFKTYSSTDLAHWTDRGFLFDASTPLWQNRCSPPAYGCYRPHVVYNASTQRYVLWINGYDNLSGYHVFTAPTPTGPFTEQPEPQLAMQGTGPGFNNGDMDLFVDTNSVGYLAYTDIRNGHRQVVEQLTSSYTSGTGQYAVVGAQGAEAPSLFRRGGSYYHVSGNTCPYCSARTDARTASNPFGPWSAPVTLNSNSCDGQPSFVAEIPTTSGTAYLYGVDRWNSGQPNQALANYFWVPLAFGATGGVQPFSCPATVTLDLATGAPGAQEPVPDLDQHSGVAGFRTHCDIKSDWSRLQSFVPAGTGLLTSASLTSFRNGASGDLVIDVVAVNSGLQPVGAPLHTTTVPRESVGWSPRKVMVSPNVRVTAGVRYALLARSASTSGCYGFGYNDAAPYPGGGSAYRPGSGGWIAESGRALKFHTSVVPNHAATAAVSASSSYTGGGWSLAAVNDNQAGSTAASMGWSSDNDLAVNHTETLTLDLGGDRTVSRVVLHPRTDAGNVGQGFPVDLAVAVSANGVSWTTVAEVNGIPTPTTGAPVVVPVNAVARYLRVEGTNLRDTNPNDRTHRMQLSEVDIH
jgi:hypothetical protein